MEEILLERELALALQLLARLGLLDDLVPDWGRFGPFSPGPGGLQAWKTLLEPLPGALRREVATRLSFSRKLSRMAGVPNR
jgi:hypothetical protein